MQRNKREFYRQEQKAGQTGYSHILHDSVVIDLHGHSANLEYWSNWYNDTTIVGQENGEGGGMGIERIKLSHIKESIDNA